MKIIIPIILMIMCFTISFLFFNNSEIIDKDTGKLNTPKITEIALELDKIPFINLGLDPELILMSQEEDLHFP